MFLHCNHFQFHSTILFTLVCDEHLVNRILKWKIQKSNHNAKEKLVENHMHTSKIDTKIPNTLREYRRRYWDRILAGIKKCKIPPEKKMGRSRWYNNIEIIKLWKWKTVKYKTEVLMGFLSLALWILVYSSLNYDAIHLNS